MARIKKATAWWVGILVFAAMFALVVFEAPEQLGAVGTAIVYGVAGLTVGYIAGNVADNGVKGAYYRAELDRKEP